MKETAGKGLTMDSIGQKRHFSTEPFFQRCFLPGHPGSQSENLRHIESEED